MTASKLETTSVPGTKSRLRWRMTALMAPICAAAAAAAMYKPSVFVPPAEQGQEAALCPGGVLDTLSPFKTVSLPGARAEAHGVSIWNALAKAYFTPEQKNLLQVAYDIGRMHGGESHAKLVQAVLLQESHAGDLGRIGHLTAPVGKRSYGVMQVKVSAARDVLQRYPGLGQFTSDEELISKLISDDAFNIRVASRYLRYLRAQTDSDQAALVAYNIGPGNARAVEDPSQFAYVAKVERYMAEVVRPFNRATKSDPARYTAM